MRLTPDVAPTLTERFNFPNLRVCIRQIAQEEARRIYALEMDKPLIKDEEDALFNAFLNGFGEAGDGLKNASLYYVLKVLTEETHIGILDVMFQRIFEKY